MLSPLTGSLSPLGARRGGAAFSPTDIAWTWWVEADQGTLLQASGGAAVTTDGDPVGYAPHHYGGGAFTQATAGLKLTYKTNIINGHPVLRCDGGDLLLATDLPVNDQQGTIFAVIKRNVTGAFEGFCSVGDNGDALTILWGVSGSPNTPWLIFNVGPVQAIGSGSSLGTTQHIVVWESNGSTWSLHVDGSSSSYTGANNGQWVADLTLHKWGIGGFTGGASFFTGDIAGIWYSSTKLAANDLDAMEAWAIAKYGI